MSEPNFWDRAKEAQETVDRLKVLKAVVEPIVTSEKHIQDLVDLESLLSDEDPRSIEEFDREISGLRREINSLEFRQLLADPLDRNDAIISINAGAGGTEACDWVSMLFRMYTRWVESKGLRLELFDELAGEEAGIKNVTFFVRGPYSFGYLKSESGVHRLVRISPFDSNKRRHTSFASVDVVADVGDIPEIEIKDPDIKIDTYRAGGAGGQHVNKTSSAVRITHLETGIVVQCQNERSQHKNKQSALKVLKARLYQRKLKEEEMKHLARYGEKKEIAWGSQIRSYVFQPYTMVKDHRTNAETSDVNRVMDGDFNLFVEAYLKARMTKSKKP